DYISENPCKELPDNCKIQNSTYNGIILPSPDPCNCCEYCLEYLSENDYCVVGGAGSMVPDSICGPGLTCVNGTCAKMETVATDGCAYAQGTYDKKRQEGTLGKYEIRPNCDGDGFYEPYMCPPGLTCFCVDKNGERIFGEIAYTNSAPLIMKCQCSRKYYEAVNIIGRELRPDEHFRCDENGDYDTIQCIGDNCMCTDTLDGAPTFPKNNPLTKINMKQENITTNVLQNIWKFLKRSKDIKKKDMTQFSTLNYPAVPSMGDTHPYRKTKCARTITFLGDSLENPECCVNGNFNPMQCKRGKCYCVDENGYQNEKEVDE
ncbi:uncharacterized protein BDFB_010688, partial [Asbolus verrucosus]